MHIVHIIALLSFFSSNTLRQEDAALIRNTARQGERNKRSQQIVPHGGY
jgi:hypothetical protein